MGSVENVYRGEMVYCGLKCKGNYEQKAEYGKTEETAIRSGDPRLQDPSVSQATV